MDNTYGIRHHAVLYALIVKYVFAYLNKDEAEKTVEKITRNYGLKRGKRMAELARINNEPLGINSFLVHGEWAGEKDENSSLLTSDQDNTISLVHKCAWYDYWKQYGLLEYGTYYCRYIDKAICKGFNGNFSLELNKAIGFGDNHCEFIWNEKYDPDYLSTHPKKWILPFSFHMKELRQTAYEVLDEKIRDEILEKVDEDFDQIFNQY